MDIIKASVDLFVGTELNKKGGKAVVESASNIANKVKREASAKLRKKWENANNKPWPKILLIPVEIKMLATKSHYPMVEQTMLATLNQNLMQTMFKSIRTKVTLKDGCPKKIINEYISKVQRYLFSVFNMLIINNKISPKRQFQLDSLIRELC